MVVGRGIRHYDSGERISYKVIAKVSRESSNLQLPTSNLQSPTSNLKPPISNFQPQTSNLQLPTSLKGGIFKLDIRVKNNHDNCVHLFRQKGRSYAREGKPFILGRFICARCGQEREFAVGMTGFWLTKSRREGSEFV